jgi:hypothetical protein
MTYSVKPYLAATLTGKGFSAHWQTPESYGPDQIQTMPSPVSSGVHIRSGMGTWVRLMSIQFCMVQTPRLPLRLRPVIGNIESLDRDGSSKGVLA